MRSRLQIFLMLIIACLVFNSRTQAQTQTRLSIQVVDTTSLEPVLGAMVELVAKDSTKIRTRYTSTDYKGSAAFGSVELGEYFLRTSLIGYVTKQVPLNIDKNPFGMVVVDLVVNAHDIEQINFSAHSMRTSQMGDTLAYNAEAFKVSRDADAEDLLAKMPGISVTDGVVEAQGEQVQKVLVDGRELFGDDVTSAIRNIPAEAIKSVEVFDKKSDEAEFSGVDDGEDYKAINFVTKPGMSNGTFGKISGSYVPDDRYSLGASINSFRGERKISLTATSNNINQQSFSIDDILGSVGSSGGMSSGKDSKGGASSYMTSSQSGVSTSNYFSLNYSEKYSEKVSATAGYSFNGTDNYLDQYSERIYTVNADSLQNYDSQYYSNSDNYNHRFNGMFEWSMNANNSLMFRPNISIQDYTSSTSTLADNYIVTSTETIEQSTYEDASSQDKFGYNMSGSLVYRHKFNDSGRSLNLSANGRISDSDNDQLSDSYTKYMTADTEEETNQETISKSASHSFTGKVSYMEPLGEYTHIIANYEYDNSYSDTDKRAYMYNPLTGGYDDFSASLSNTYQ
ncbi:MAG: TonB-dependent receptor, partial [Rikenellaceae bacterium]